MHCMRHKLNLLKHLFLYLRTMTKSVLDKASIGDQFINYLATDQKCFSFTNGKNDSLACNCCSKFGCQIDSVKVFFNKLNNSFWSQKCPPKPVSTVKKTSDEKNSFAISEGKQLAIFWKNTAYFSQSISPSMSLLFLKVKKPSLFLCASLLQ